TATLYLRSLCPHRPAATEIRTLTLHDALPIWRHPLPIPLSCGRSTRQPDRPLRTRWRSTAAEPSTKTAISFAAGTRLSGGGTLRSEEHTSELQSREKLVCRLLLEKKNQDSGWG